MESAVKQFTLEQVKHLLSTNQAWVQKAILTLYNRQTSEEQNAETTIEHNGVGFNGVDAKVLSYYAQYMLKGKEERGVYNNLSGKHLERAFKIVPKYAKQILSVINNS